MFLLSYFRTTSENLHFALSSDGIMWDVLNQNKPILECTVSNKSVRDPFLQQGADGKYHLIFTDSWRSKNIIYTCSQDLIHWEPQRVLPIMESVPSTVNTWAPEFVYDPTQKLYFIFWSSTTNPRETFLGKRILDHRIWYCTTTDFQNFSSPAIFFDPEYTIIDATIIRHQETWYMAFKDERGKNIPTNKFKAMKIAQTAQLPGPWKIITPDYVTPHLTEGPYIFRNGSEYWMIFDHFMSGNYGIRKSSDLIHWEPIMQKVEFPPGTRHASVMEISADLANQLKNHYR